jgi:NADPH-dependent 2,4-dienoyl-CoA reductase/sulfur reductase-like enzyme/rhodanese-related sulfurtransferase
MPSIEGLNNINYFSMRTVNDMDNVKKFIEEQNPENAVVIGGGYVGIETAEALMHCNLNVTLIEAANHILPVFPPEVTLKIKDTMTSAGITILEKTLAVKVKNENDKIIVELNNGQTIKTDLLMLCTGVKPDVSLAKTAGVNLGKFGGITVNEKMETSIKNIYAAGDVTEKISKISGESFLLPLAGPANRQGRVAGCNAAGGNMIFPPVVGTSIVGFADACVAHTGLTYEQALEYGFDADFIYTEDAHRVTYYPDYKYIFIKLVFDKKSSKILGATASGTVGVERRIDILSTAIYSGLTVYDLENLETCYAPQFGAPKDNVNILGFVASNRLRKIGYGITPQEFLELPKDIQLIDVRTRIEFKIEKLENAVNMYVNELRDKLDKLDISKPVYIYCTVGFRGFIAVRILRQLGYEAYNILGGIDAVKRLQAL